MKIIDKNKDYYDFLMGVYGQDPKAVTTGEAPPYCTRTGLQSR